MKIAVIQNKSIPKNYESNIKSIEQQIKLIANKDIDLIILPELFATGYCANKDIFQFGEEENGKTIKWLKTKAKELGGYLGGGIPIFDNNELYNRYYLFNKEGDISGFSQKQFGETYCFKRDEGIFLIQTEIGNIGVSICADSHFTSTIESLQNLDIDILLMPHAWPTMQSGSQNEIEFCSEVAQLLKVPVVFINGVGKIEKMQGLMGSLMSPDKFELRGKSCIINSYGEVLAKLEEIPDILVCEIKIGKDSNDKPKVPSYSGWVHKGSWFLRNLIIPIDIWNGKRVYKKNIQIQKEHNIG